MSIFADLHRRTSSGRFSYSLAEMILDVDDGMKHRCAVNLHNVVMVSQGRLGKRVASLSEQRMQEVCAALRFSLGCV
jgi:mRNA-degrading endonuclease toxin of MazEF toxin-antitoxin module